MQVKTFTLSKVSPNNFPLLQPQKSQLPSLHLPYFSMIYTYLYQKDERGMPKNFQFQLIRDTSR